MERAKRRLTLILMTLAFVICFAGFKSADAQAATKALKKIKYSPVLTNRIAQKATVVKKGTTTLSIKEKGYVKFVVPKTKKYTFTFSGMRSSRSSYNCGYAYIDLPVANEYSSEINLDHQYFNTKGGSASTAWFASRSSSGGDKKLAYLSVRSCSLVLQKGQTLYIYISSANKGSINLKIK